MGINRTKFPFHNNTAPTQLGGENREIFKNILTIDLMVPVSDGVLIKAFPFKP